MATRSARPFLESMTAAFGSFLNRLLKRPGAFSGGAAAASAGAFSGVSGSEKAILCDAIEDLSPNGGTNGSAGLIRCKAAALAVVVSRIRRIFT